MEPPQPGSRYIAHSAYAPDDTDELELVVGDIVELVEYDDDGWWLCRNPGSSKQGFTPSNFLNPAPAPVESKMSKADKAKAEKAEKAKAKADAKAEKAKAKADSREGSKRKGSLTALNTTGTATGTASSVSHSSTASSVKDQPKTVASGGGAEYQLAGRSNHPPMPETPVASNAPQKNSNKVDAVVPSTPAVASTSGGDTAVPMSIKDKIAALQRGAAAEPKKKEPIELDGLDELDVFTKKLEFQLLSEARTHKTASVYGHDRASIVDTTAKKIDFDESPQESTAPRSVSMYGRDRPLAPSDAPANNTSADKKRTASMYSSSSSSSSKKVVGGGARAKVDLDSSEMDVDAESDIDVDSAPTPIRDSQPAPTLTDEQENDPIIKIAHGKLLAGKLTRDEFDHIVRMQERLGQASPPLARKAPTEPTAADIAAVEAAADAVFGKGKGSQARVVDPDDEGFVFRGSTHGGKAQSQLSALLNAADDEYALTPVTGNGDATTDEYDVATAGGTAEYSFTKAGGAKEYSFASGGGVGEYAIATGAEVDAAKVDAAKSTSMPTTATTAVVSQQKAKDSAGSGGGKRMSIVEATGSAASGDFEAVRLANKLSKTQADLAESEETVTLLEQELAEVRAALEKELKSRNEAVSASAKTSPATRTLEADLAKVKSDLATATSRLGDAESALARAESALASERTARVAADEKASNLENTVAQQASTIDELRRLLAAATATSTSTASTTGTAPAAASTKGGSASGVTRDPIFLDDLNAHIPRLPLLQAPNRAQPPKHRSPSTRPSYRDMKASGSTRDLYSADPVDKSTLVRGSQATKRVAPSSSTSSSSAALPVVAETPVATPPTPPAATASSATPRGAAGGASAASAKSEKKVLTRGKTAGATKGRRKLPSVPGTPSKLLSDTQK